MTGILIGCVAVIALASALYVLIVREDLVAALWYRVFPGEDPYVPEAAEAPDPVDEHFKTAPRVVAGSDIDRQLAIARAKTDATFAEIVAADLADLDTHLTAYYVLPEGDR